MSLLKQFASRWKKDKYPIDRDAVYLFPDTNFFHEFTSPQDTRWGESIETDNIILVLTTPILREIDSQKTAKNVRVQKGARALNSLIADIAGEAGRYYEYRPESPRVRLILRPDLRPEPKLAQRLDYSSNNAADHQLVGIIAGFKARYPYIDSRLLTDDTGPKTAADMVGVPFVQIPESWRRTLGTSDEERTIRRLEGDLQRVMSREPRLEVRAITDNNDTKPQFHLEQRKFLPLTDAETDDLIRRITERYPVRTKYDIKLPPSSSSDKWAIKIDLALHRKWTPPSNESISKYRDEAYPQWLDKIGETLRTLHEYLNKSAAEVFVDIEIANVGTRPATSTEVRVSCQGPFWLTFNDQGSNNENGSLTLPDPPDAPKGKWVDAVFAPRFADTFKATFPIASNFDSPRLPPFNRPIQRDPHGFYYGERVAIQSSQSITATCLEYRHGEDPELFRIFVNPMSKGDQLKGLIKVEIHATNLTDPVKSQYPVTLSFTEESCYTYAEELVVSLINP